MPFCAFFHVQPKYQNGAIFVHIEGLRSCLSKPSYGAPKWALMVRLMQKTKKNGLNRPRNRYSRKPGLLVMSQKRPFGPFWPVISETGWTSRKKYHLESGLNHRDEAKSAASYIKSFVKAANFFSMSGAVCRRVYD